MFGWIQTMPRTESDFGVKAGDEDEALRKRE